VLTYPNADDGGRMIIPLIEEYAAARPQQVLAIPSLGQVRYLSAVKYAAAVIGNSSSGIIEVPSFNVPTVNVGERQRGRTAAKSVLTTGTSTKAITDSIQTAIDMELMGVENPYGSGMASAKILNVLKNFLVTETKKFYDL